MSIEQETALQIVQTSNKIATPEQLAAVIQNEPRYYTYANNVRIDWVGKQIMALCYMAHSTKIPSEFDLFMESAMLDQMIMDEDGLRGLTLVEMQEAFRRGISREYGEYYGITAPSLVMFLRGFRNCAKRLKAISILYEREQSQMKKEDELFWKELNNAKKRGLNIPSFANSPNEDSKQHRQRIARQRAEILRTYNADDGK